jgi:hypothetical protein
VACGDVNAMLDGLVQQGQNCGVDAKLSDAAGLGLIPPLFRTFHLN